MHDLSLPEQFLAMIRGMRDGREHALRDLDPRRLAHVVIDMQNGYLEEGMPLEVPAARAIVPNINRFSRSVRAAGGLNVFIQYTMHDQALKDWSIWHYGHHGPASLAATRAGFAPGGHAWGLWPELEIEAGDEVVEKHRFSAILPQSGGLDAILRTRGITTIAVSGTTTNICCESTARDAMQLNYAVLFLSDATATWSDAIHNAALANMCVFTDVVTTDEAISLVEQSSHLGGASK